MPSHRIIRSAGRGPVTIRFIIIIVMVVVVVVVVGGGGVLDWDCGVRT